MGLMRCGADRIVSGPLTPDVTAEAEYDTHRRFLFAAADGAIIWPSVVGRWEPLPTWGAVTHRYSVTGVVSDA